MSSAAANAAQSTLEFTTFPDNDHPEKQNYILRLPTVHVHGRQNQGLHLYERLLQQYYGKGSASLVEWDGDQRVPLKPKYVEVIVEQITAIVKESGVMNES